MNQNHQSVVFFPSLVRVRASVRACQWSMVNVCVLCLHVVRSMVVHSPIILLLLARRKRIKRKLFQVSTRHMHPSSLFFLSLVLALLSPSFASVPLPLFMLLPPLFQFSVRDGMSRLYLTRAPGQKGECQVVLGSEPVTLLAEHRRISFLCTQGQGRADVRNSVSN